MWIYLINLFSLFVWGFIYKKCENKSRAKKCIIFAIVLQFTLLQGLRGVYVGNDTENYVKYYNLISQSDLSLYEWVFVEKIKFEIGWLTLMKICGFFHLSSQAFLIVVAAIINSLFGYFVYKQSDDFIMSYWIFIGMEFFALSFTMLRQMIALLLIVNSLRYIREKKPFAFYSLLFLAILFHKTALIFVVMYPIYAFVDKYQNKFLHKFSQLKNRFLNAENLLIFIKFILSICLVLICLYLLKPIIVYLSHLIYGYYSSLEGVELGGQWIELIAILVMLLFADKYCDKNKLLIFQLFALFALLFQTGTIFISYLSRIVMYFTIFSTVSLPYIIENMKHKKIKFVFKFMLYLAFFLQYILYMNLYHLIPYSLSFI